MRDIKFRAWDEATKTIVLSEDWEDVDELFGSYGFLKRIGIGKLDLLFYQTVCMIRLPNCIGIGFIIILTTRIKKLSLIVKDWSSMGLATGDFQIQENSIA